MLKKLSIWYSEHFYLPMACPAGGDNIRFFGKRLIGTILQNLFLSLQNAKANLYVLCFILLDKQELLFLNQLSLLISSSELCTSKQIFGQYLFSK